MLTGVSDFTSFSSGESFMQWTPGCLLVHLIELETQKAHQTVRFVAATAGENVTTAILLFPVHAVWRVIQCDVDENG